MPPVLNQVASFKINIKNSHNQIYEKMIRLLKSNNFALYVAIVSILGQAPHSYFVIHSISQISGFWAILQGIVFALAIDASLIFYTLRGRKDIARVFAVAMFLINLLYYWPLLAFSAQFAGGVLISFLLPLSIYHYSEEIKDNTPPIATNGQSKPDDIEEMKRMRSEGLSYNKIAEKMNSNQGTVYRQLKRNKNKNDN